jgi:ketosteroid isomerase-like protein
MKADDNESTIRRIIEDWAKAVRKRDIKSILAHHDKNIVMYDVPPPLQSKGIEAYSETWDLYYAYATDDDVFDVIELNIVASDDVAFCYGIVQCETINSNSEKETLTFRLTTGLKRIKGQWIIVHEHHSLPAG